MLDSIIKIKSINEDNAYYFDLHQLFLEFKSSLMMKSYELETNFYWKSLFYANYLGDSLLWSILKSNQIKLQFSENDNKTFQRKYLLSEIRLLEQYEDERGVINATNEVIKANDEKTLDEQSVVTEDLMPHLLYDATGLESACEALFGRLLLPSPLRRAIWLFRFAFDKRVGGHGGSEAAFMHELTRLAARKGLSVSLSGPSAAPLRVSNAAAIALAIAELSIQPFHEASEGLPTLTRRAEHSLHAVYILTGAVPPRMVRVALLLLLVFPADPPVSEPMLRMLLCIGQRCLPSPHSSRDYSTRRIAAECLNLLRLHDPDFPALTAVASEEAWLLLLAHMVDAGAPMLA